MTGSGRETAPLSAAEEADLRAAHWPQMRVRLADNEAREYCASGDAQPWPCNVACLLATLDAAREPAGRDAVREALAAIEHEQWMAWSQDLMSKELLTGDRIARWQSLWVPYAELSEEMKEHDRKWADKVLAALADPAPGGETDATTEAPE